jgi:glucan 1,3-beta-glucosidase
LDCITQPIINNAEISSTVATFEHWPVRSAGWVGQFDRGSATYVEVDYGNFNLTLRVIESLAIRYADSSSVLGLEPVNEPWQFTPLDILKRFYWQVCM